MITGLFDKPFENVVVPKMLCSIIQIDLPFNGHWTVFWGGDTKAQNYHVAVAFQKNAFDIVANNKADN